MTNNDSAIQKFDEYGDNAVKISMVRRELIIGDKSILAFMDAKGEYYTHSSQAANLIDKKGSAVESFIVQNAVNSRSLISLRMGFNECKALYRKGLYRSPDWDPSLFVENGNNYPYRVIPLETVVNFIRFWDKKGDSVASNLTEALMLESLKVRCEAAFVGVSPNVLDIINGTNHWLASRNMSKSVQGAFQQFCMSNKLQAGNVHNRMTMHLFGQTKRMAINNNKLIGEDPTIGLDRQDSPEGLLAIAKMKVKFMSYRKGTWQERVDRCFLESI